MKVNLLCYEPPNSWVLWDFAARIGEQLHTLVEKVEISGEQLPGFDVTYHINYAGMLTVAVPGVHSTMVTHIDSPAKFALVQSQAKAGVHGVCMSESTARMLRQLSGEARFSALLAPSMVAQNPARAKVLVGSRVYPDGRKNERWVHEFSKAFPPGLLELKIMGAGWEPVVEDIQRLGHAVDYRPEFNKEAYEAFLADVDYLLYTGFDEGSMSVVDAIIYGVTPIVTAQGFHLELPSGILLFSTLEELSAIARRIAAELAERNRYRDSLRDWKAYAAALVATWAELVRNSGLR